MRRFHISAILICMALLITSSFSQALAYFNILDLNKTLYNPDKENLSGRLCWQISGYFGEDEYSSNYIRTFDLATGKSKTYYGTGMIIQKNPQEYHGALLAKLNGNGAITIFHQDGADTNEIVYNGYLPENIADYSQITIEAYMNGAIYYTTYADRNSPFRLKRYHTDTGYIYIYKINKDGTSLSASNFQLSPDGRAAWISRNSGSPSINDSYPSFLLRPLR